MHQAAKGVGPTGVSSSLATRRSYFCTGAGTDNMEGRWSCRLCGTCGAVTRVARALRTSSWIDPLALWPKAPQGSVFGAVSGVTPLPGFLYFLLSTNWTREGRSSRALIFSKESLCLFSQWVVIVDSFLARYGHVPIGHNHNNTWGWWTSA